MKLEKILKWVGILALISLQLLLFTKRKKSSYIVEPEVNDDDIFAEELHEGRR